MEVENEARYIAGLQPQIHSLLFDFRLVKRSAQLILAIRLIYQTVRNIKKLLRKHSN